MFLGLFFILHKTTSGRFTRSVKQGICQVLLTRDVYLLFVRRKRDRLDICISFITRILDIWDDA